VRIVSSLPSRGASAVQTKAISDAISTAIAERGGSAGKWRVEYIPLEGGSDETGEWTPDRELPNSTVAATDPSVIAYIGPYNSGAAAVSLPVTNKAQLLEASPSATWPGLTLGGWGPDEPGRYFPSGASNFIRLMAPDSVQAEAAAQWAAGSDFTSALVLEDGSTYSAGMADAFSEQAAREGLTITERRRLQMKEVVDLGQHTSASEAVFYAPSTVRNAVKVAKALNGKARTVFATDTALDTQFVDQARDAAKAWRVISNSVPAGPTRKYAPLYLKGAHKEFATQFAANAYSITNLILDGVASGTGRDRGALLSFLRSSQATHGDGLGFTTSGDPDSWTVSGYEMQGDQFVLTRTFEGQADR